MSRQPQGQEQTERLAKCYSSLRSSVESNFVKSESSATPASTICDTAISEMTSLSPPGRQALWLAHISGLLESAVSRGPLNTTEVVPSMDKTRSRVSVIKKAPTEEVFRQMCVDAKSRVTDEEAGAWEPRSFDEALASAEAALCSIGEMKQLGAGVTQEWLGGGGGLSGVSRALLTAGVLAAGTLAYLWLTGEEDEYDEYLNLEY